MGNILHLDLTFVYHNLFGLANAVIKGYPTFYTLSQNGTLCRHFVLAKPAALV